MTRMRRRIVTLLAAGTLSLGLAGPATAQVEQDGLVNVAIGDITIEDVNIGVAAGIAANVCPDVRVGAVAVLGRAVDRSGDSEIVCTADAGDVTLEQN